MSNETITQAAERAYIQKLSDEAFIALMGGFLKRFEEEVDAEELNYREQQYQAAMQQREDDGE